MNFPQKELKEWFSQEKRSFPWRENPTPYRVWISEVMLQQTQSSVVVSYFEKWMDKFPTVDKLASASAEEVIKTWEGLGYYSRARHLHEAAKTIMRDHNGEIPSSEVELAKIKGLGPYTIGAIRGFAFHQKAAAVDGNVMRVLSRFFAIEEPIDLPAVQKRIRTLAQDILPDETPWEVTEGLIELGATICKKKPSCLSCPIKKGCRAFQKGIQETLPQKKKKLTVTTLFRLVAVVECEGEILLRKGQRGKVMADLYEFPFLEIASEKFSIEEALKQFSLCLERSIEYLSTLEVQQHGFTRFRAFLFPFSFRTEHKMADEIWVKKEKLKELPFSSGHRRILRSL